MGTLWFAIFLQLFLILGVVHTLATDSLAMNRFQISVFGAVAIVFSVIGVDRTIFTSRPALDAVAAGWLILAIVNILWTLYFTSEEDSLMLHVFNSMGTGGLTPPGRRRRRTQSVHNMTTNGYTAGYAAPGTLGPTGYDAKTNSFAGPIGSNASFKANSVDARSINAASQNAGSIRNGAPGSVTGENTVSLGSPLMGPGAAGVGAGGGMPMPTPAPAMPGPADTSSGEFVYRAKAMYPCTCYFKVVITTGRLTYNYRQSQPRRSK